MLLLHIIVTYIVCHIVLFFLLIILRETHAVLLQEHQQEIKPIFDPHGLNLLVVHPCLFRENNNVFPASQRQFIS